MAYLPDVTEWVLRLCRVRIPHSATASLPCTLAGCAAVYAILRFGFRERGRVAMLVGLTAFASHMALDLVSGGIPLWWPLTNQEVGTDWLTFDGRPGYRERLMREALVFAPVVAVAVAVGVVRARGIRWSPAVTWNLVPALPVLILAGLQLYVWEQMRRGLAHHRAREYETAIEHYSAASRLNVVDLQGTAQARVAQCLVGLGKNDAALAILDDGRRAYPWNMEYVVGYAELYLLSHDERYQRPAAALELIDQLLAYGGTPTEVEYYRNLRTTALMQIGEKRSAAEERPPAWPTSR
jgi:tetratricopeptide (TPR) repeat protein